MLVESEINVCPNSKSDRPKWNKFITLFYCITLTRNSTSNIIWQKSWKVTLILNKQGKRFVTFLSLNQFWKGDKEVNGNLRAKGAQGLEGPPGGDWSKFKKRQSCNLLLGFRLHKFNLHIHFFPFYSWRLLNMDDTSKNVWMWICEYWIKYSWC